MITLSHIVLIVFSQSSPPCPPNMTLIECQLCTTLYEEQGIEFEDCPCWDETYSPILEAGEGTGMVGYCCTPVGCIEEFICYEECMELSPDSVFLGDTNCVDGGCPTYSDTGCCINMQCQVLNAYECVVMGGSVQADLCNTGCPIGSISTEGACCWIDVELVQHCDMRDQGDCEGELNYQSWIEGENCDDDPCLVFPDDLCPDPSDIGVCCINDSCVENTPVEVCNAVGTQYVQDGVCDDLEDCDSDPPVTGACCVGLTCVEVSEVSCQEVGGGFYAGLSCSQVDCGDDDPDPPDGELTLACCWEDNTCTDDVPVTVCIEAQGRPKYGTCSTISCEMPGDNKTCVCILLDQLVSLNTAMLQELIDIGVSLDTANEYLQAIANSSANIEQHTVYLLIALEMIQTDVANINENVELLISELTNSPADTNYQGNGTNNAVHIQNLENSSDDVVSNLSGINPIYPEDPFGDGGGEGGLGVAPVITIDVPAVTIGSFTADMQPMDFDMQMLADWGVVQLLRTIIIFAVTWWSVKHLYEELRRYG